MRSYAAILMASALTMSATTSRADATDVCRDMVDGAAHNVGINMSSSDVLDTIYSHYCESDGSTKDSGFNIGLSAIVYGIPASLTGGSHDAQTQVTNFCKNYQNTYVSHSAAFTYNSRVVEAALKSANDCLNILSKYNDTITYHILTPQMLSISFVIQAGQQLDIRGVTHDSPGVDCVGNLVAGTGSVSYSTGHGQTMNAGAGPYTITCKRVPISVQGGTSFYNETAIVADTNVGSLDIVWPQETMLPLSTASQIQASIAALTAKVNYNLLPIGAIVPWFVQGQNPPPGWAPCDGSDKTHCPDLRGLFLLGGASGDVTKSGGALTASLDIKISDDDMNGDGNGWNRNNPKFSKKENYQINLPKPPYMTVLYIIKFANS